MNTITARNLPAVGAYVPDFLCFSKQSSRKQWLTQNDEWDSLSRTGIKERKNPFRIKIKGLPYLAIKSRSRSIGQSKYLTL